MLSSAILARTAASLSAVSTITGGSSVFLKLGSSLTRVDVLSCFLNVHILARPLGLSVDAVPLVLVELFLEGMGGAGCI